MDTRGGLQIGTIRGIPIRIHVSFLLVLPLLAYAFGRSFIEAARLAGVPPERLSGSPYLWGLGIALALFVSVLIHELAHSLYALSKGGAVRSITLLMIGGVSRIARPPRTPGQEAAMAVVGPLTSLALGALFFGIFRATLGLRSFDVSFACFYLAQLNLFLGLFNLLPAFPMDGGRVLRGLLTRSKGPVRATQIAAAVGKAFAVLFGIVGLLWGNFILVIIAFFVFIGAEGEERDVLARALLGDLRVRELMAPQVAAVAPGETVFDIGERMIRERRLAYPVADEGQVLGLVTFELVERVPLDRRRVTAVREAMAPAVSVGPDERVADALRLLGEGRAGELAVVLDGGRLVGTLSRVELLRGLRLRELEVSQHPPAPSPRRAEG